MSERLCVVMPVYNEQEAIGPVLAKWAKALDALGMDYVIRPYNDGSKDDSLAVMKQAASCLPHVEVRDKPNGGHGNTILTGYREAAADGFDWVFQIDSDDEMGPEKFGELWAKRHEYDFLVGIRDGRVQQLPRKVISLVSRLCVRLFYGRSVWDVNTPYRLMRVQAFKGFFQSIPLATFAPNVILSGLAARHKLRSHEIRVPQHDRRTGEVSIKKWKLLKAAARSFGQTILFSLSGKSGSNGAWAGTLVAFIAFTIVLSMIDYTSFPWVDEVGTTDTAVSCVLKGEWNSHIWPYSYNPLHIQVLTAWLWLFGVSHFSVCALGVVLGLLTCVAMQRVLVRAEILKTPLQNVLFALLFWCGSWKFSYILTCGRIDLLISIFTILLVAELLPNTSHRSLLFTFVYSFFLMLSGIYSIPIVVFFGIGMLMWSRSRKERREIIKNGITSAFAMAVAFGLSCVYYAYHQCLFHFVYTYFSFNATVAGSAIGFWRRVFLAYSHEVSGLVIFGLAFAGLLIFRKKSVNWAMVAFVALIPFWGVVGGRYEHYYSWEFYLPVLALLAVVLNHFKPRMTCAAIAVVIMVGAVRIVVNWDDWSRTASLVAAGEKCVAEHPDLFRPGQQIVLDDFLMYYPAVNSGASIWSVDRLQDRESSPQEKFQRFAQKIPISQVREKVEFAFKRYEKHPEPLSRPYHRVNSKRNTVETFR